MPVARRSVQSAPSQDGFIQFRNYPDQTSETTEDVQRMSYCEHVEERVADVGGESEALGPELHPGEGLPGDKEQAEKESYVEPARRAGWLVFYSAHEAGNPAARHLEREAA